MITFKKIIDRFEAWADAHLMVGAFDWGEYPDKAADQNPVWPLMYVVPQTNSFPGTSNFLNEEQQASFDIFFMSTTEHEGSETDEHEDSAKTVLSDMMLIITDLIAEISQAGTYFDFDGEQLQIVGSPTADWFLEDQNHVLTGWSISLTLKFVSPGNKCKIPYDGADPVTPGECPDVTINMNSAPPFQVDTVEAGGQFTINVLTHRSQLMMDGDGYDYDDVTKVFTLRKASVKASDDVELYEMAPGEEETLLETYIEDSEGTKLATIYPRDGENVYVQPDCPTVPDIKGCRPRPPFDQPQILTGDAGYLYANGFYPDQGEIIPRRLVSDYQLHADTPNPFSAYPNAARKRFTGTSGGYYNEVAGTYHDRDGNSVSASVAFVDGFVIDWATDLIYTAGKQGIDTIPNHHTAAQALTFPSGADNPLSLSFGEERMINLPEMESIMEQEYTRTWCHPFENAAIFCCTRDEANQRWYYHTLSRLASTTSSSAYTFYVANVTYS